jgi:hypothetical protein
MGRYKEGKWPSNGSLDEADAEVMKFIGRTEFVSATSSEATAPATANDPEESIQIGAHQVLFDYMQYFENRAEQDTSAHSGYQPQGSASYFPPEQDIILQVIPELASGGAFESFLSGGFFGNNGHHSEPLNLTGQTNSSTNWPPSGLYDDASLISNSLHGYPSNDFSLPLNDLLPDQGTGVGPGDEQVSQDQLWEQLLSGFMP